MWSSSSSSKARPPAPPQTRSLLPAAAAQPQPCDRPEAAAGGPAPRRSIVAANAEAGLEPLGSLIGEDDVAPRLRYAGQDDFVDVWDRIREPLHADFYIPGFHGVKRCVFLPCGMVGSPETASILLKHWKLQRPNLLLEMNDTAHCLDQPVTQEMINSSDDFKELRELFADGAGPKTSPRRQVPNDMVTTVNEIFRDNLERIAASIVTAVDTSNSWLLHRVGTWVGANHLLVERAVETSQSNPTFLVVDDPFLAEKTDNHQAKDLRLYGFFTGASMQLLKRAKPLKSFFGEPVQLSVHRDQLISMKFAGERRYCDEMEKSRRRAGVPDDVVQKEWEMYNPNAVQPHWCCRAGTHFVFAPDCGKFNGMHYSHSKPGYLFGFGEDAVAKAQFFEAARRQSPAVVIKYTRTFAHEVAMLLDRLVSPAEPDYEKKVAERWEQVCQVSGKFTVTSLADTFHVMSLNRLHPRLFRDTIVAVNPMTHSPDQVLKTLSQSFSSAALANTEVGAGSADKSVVLSTWHMHRVLHRSTTRQRHSDSCTLVVSLLVSFMATAAAVIVPVALRMQQGKSCELEGVIEFGIGSYPVIILAALVTLLNTIVMSTNYSMKWGQLHLASTQLVAEIYKFRMRALAYQSQTVRAVSNVDEDLLDLGGEESATALCKGARLRFSAKVQNLFKSVQEGEMATDALDLAAEGEHSELESPAQQQEHLSRHVLESVYSMPLPKPSKASTAAAVTEHPHNPGYALFTNDHEAALEDLRDDLLGTISTEAYVACRIGPLLQKQRRDARMLKLFHHTMQMLVFATGTGATLMAAVNAQEYVPVWVALGSALSSFTQACRFKQRLVATNSAVASLSNCLTFWHSLSIVDRRLATTRERLVRDTEDAVLSIAVAASGSTPFQLSTDEAPEAQGREAQGKRDKEDAAK